MKRARAGENRERKRETSRFGSSLRIFLSCYKAPPGFVIQMGCLRGFFSGFRDSFLFNFFPLKK